MSDIPSPRVATGGPPLAGRRRRNVRQYPDDPEGIEFWRFACHVEPCQQRMPSIENSAEDYTNGLLEQRQYWADYTRYSCSRRSPNMWRYTNCYAYYIAQAIKYSNISLRFVDDENSRLKRLQACRQIMEFEKTHETNSHPCDMPATGEGRAVWGCTTDLLRYTLYTRYHAYLGHTLNTFEGISIDNARELWYSAYRNIVSERERELNNQREASDQQQMSSGALSVSAVLHRMENDIGLLPSTITNAIESLVHETPEDEGLEAARTLEVLVLQMKYQTLAQMLYRDFVASSTLMRFDEIDSDVVHMQAVIKAMILLLFNVICHPGEHDLDTSTWNATSMLTRCTDLLNPNNYAMYQELHTLTGKFALGAERRFRDTWDALRIDRDEDDAEVKSLLKYYLATLGVKQISEIDDSGEEEIDTDTEEEISTGHDGINIRGEEEEKNASGNGMVGEFDNMAYDFDTVDAVADAKMANLREFIDSHKASLGRLRALLRERR